MPQHNKRGYLLENFRLFHLKSRGGTQVEYHYHEFCKILLLVQGSGGYYIDGQRYLLQSGDIVLLDAHSIHRPEIDGDVPYERIILYVSPEYLQQQSTPECNLRSVFSGNRRFSGSPLLWNGKWPPRPLAGRSSATRVCCGCWWKSDGTGRERNIPAPIP